MADPKGFLTTGRENAPTRPTAPVLRPANGPSVHPAPSDSAASSSTATPWPAHTSRISAS